MHGGVDPIHEDEARGEWQQFTKRISASRRHKIKLAITGKYAALRDAYASIDKAIEHCATDLCTEIETHWIDTSTIKDSAYASEALEGMDGIIVPGGFGLRGVEGKILCVEYARTHALPYLGICLGFQVAVIEYARNVMGLPGAHSTEFEPDCAGPIIAELPEQKELEGILGGTMRLGAQDVQLDQGSLAAHLYGDVASVRERFRHRYEVEPGYIDRLNESGLRFSGRHPDYPIMQLLELERSRHPFFVGAQFHPELTSRPLSPSPLFMGLVAAAIRKSDPDNQLEDLSPRWQHTSTPEDTTNGHEMAGSSG
jgi:CTP synthase